MKIPGRNIRLLSTIGSRYANGFLDCGFIDDEGKWQTGRIHTSEIKKILSNYSWELNLPDNDGRRAYIYLENPKEE